MREKAKGRSRHAPALMPFWGGRRDSNPRHSEPQSDALPTELRPPYEKGMTKNGTPEGTRTPDPLLRRQLLYPPELLAHMERVMGIEPTRPAWKAGILPLNYTRITSQLQATLIIIPSLSQNVK